MRIGMAGRSDVRFVQRSMQQDHSAGAVCTCYTACLDMAWLGRAIGSSPFALALALALRCLAGLSLILLLIIFFNRHLCTAIEFGWNFDTAVRLGSTPTCSQRAMHFRVDFRHLHCVNVLMA